MRRIPGMSMKHTKMAGVLLVALLVFSWSFNHAIPKGLAVVNASQSAGIPNNRPQPNPGGRAATFSTQGAVDLTGEYFKPQGTNGRSCATCHVPEDAWSINPGTLQRLFDETEGTHAVFKLLDANNPSMDVSTVEGRLAAYSMMLSRGVFRRGGTPRADSEWELIEADDPHGYANTSRLVHWRRVMPTINFAVGSATVNWDGGNSVGADQHAGLGQPGDPQHDRRAAGSAANGCRDRQHCRLRNVAVHRSAHRPGRRPSR